MKSSRLYELFGALSRKDVRELKKAVASPFFNQRNHVEGLLHYLIECRYERQVEPDRREAFARLFPERAFDDHKFRLSMSLLVKVIEQYLILQEATHQEIDAELALARAYRRLQLPRHFKKSIARAGQYQADSRLRHAEHYQHEYDLQLETYRFYSTQRRMDDLHLQPVLDNQETAFIAGKLRHACFALSHQTVYQQAYDLGMLPEILSYLERSDLLEVPAIAVYYYCYQALAEPEESRHFQQFRSLVFAHQELFPQNELRDLLLLAANHCIRRMNAGDQRFAHEGLRIYKEGLKNGVLVVNGRLSHFTYRNIVAKAIVAREFEWAATFLHEYKPLLEERYREPIFCFNLAWLEYERGHFDHALDLLHQSTFHDILLNLSAKTIAMKIYYELGAHELLHSHLEAMRSFIHRRKIITYHKEHYLNTIRFTKKLLDLPPSDTTRRARLRQKIEHSKVVAEKKWLLVQVGG